MILSAASFLSEFVKLIQNFASLILVASCLSATPRHTSAIRLHGTMSADGFEARLSVISKDQNKIKATLSNAQRTIVVDVYFIDNKVYLTKQSPDGKTEHGKLEGDEAASHLLELLAFNPDYHFGNSDEFDLSTPALGRFKVALTRSETAIEETEVHPPQSVSVYREDAHGATPIRTVRYLKFRDQIEPFLQPTEMEFVDEKTGKRGSISIDKIEYNAGLPDFLFEIPEKTN